MEEWSSDNVPFPAAAYATYIRELYQENALVRGQHHVAGRRVDLSAITCPVLTVVTSKDTICPPPAARALNDASRSAAPQVIEVPGGHVGAVVGGKAATTLYPALTNFFSTHCRSDDACNSAN
jgi:polyhydroxyalkanoate synthase